MDVEALFTLSFWSMNIPTTMALAAVALIGYLFGQRTRKPLPEDPSAREELLKANQAARELERIAESVRQDLAVHRVSVNRFKERINCLRQQPGEPQWSELCAEAEEVLKPTLKLAMQISLAYDGIRQQSTQLMGMTEDRTDVLTGVNNRRVLDETLENMFAILPRLEQSFSVAIFDIDHFKQLNQQHGHSQGDRTLQKFAKLLEKTARGTDVVVRYGGEEFVVIMPNTNLEGASIFAERMRKSVITRLPLTISGGLAMAVADDNPQTLLSRADSALYSAKVSGRNRVYRHTGQEIEPIVPDAPPTVAPHQGDAESNFERDSTATIAVVEHHPAERQAADDERSSSLEPDESLTLVCQR